jgi:hypothetical protein
MAIEVNKKNNCISIAFPDGKLAILSALNDEDCNSWHEALSVMCKQQVPNNSN